jgi:hypothetical protein
MINNDLKLGDLKSKIYQDCEFMMLQSYYARQPRAQRQGWRGKPQHAWRRCKSPLCTAQCGLQRFEMHD